MPQRDSADGGTRLDVHRVGAGEFRALLGDFGAILDEWGGGVSSGPPPASAHAARGFAVLAYGFEAGVLTRDEDGWLSPAVACLLDTAADEAVALSLAAGHAVGGWHVPAWANFVGVVDRATGSPVDIYPVQRRAA
jgi:hypothetical protein